MGVMQRSFGWSASGVRPVQLVSGIWGCASSPALCWERLRATESSLGVAAIASELTREVAHSPASPRGSSVDGGGPRGTG